MGELNVILLHDPMVGKDGRPITTSLTPIDAHDIARSARTYGAHTTFIAHPSPTIRKLAHTIRNFWDEGIGAAYNPNRKEALERIEIVTDLDEAVHKIDVRTGKLPRIVATSAKEGGKRIGYREMRAELERSDDSFLIMFGTGWGMTDELLERAELFLEPVRGPGEYNHLSVRSACAIVLDRLTGR